MSDNYCDNCGKKVPIWIRYKAQTIKYASRMTTYDEVYAICEPGIDIYERSSYAV